MQSEILVIHVPGRDPLIFAGPADNLAAAFDGTGADGTNVYALFYKSDLATLGLEAGPQRFQSSGGRPLPLPADALLTATVTAGQRLIWNDTPDGTVGYLVGIQIRAPLAPCPNYCIKEIGTLPTSSRRPVVAMMDASSGIVAADANLYIVGADHLTSLSTATTNLRPGAPILGAFFTSDDQIILYVEDLGSGRLFSGTTHGGFTAVPNSAGGPTGLSATAVDGDVVDGTLEVFVATDGGDLARFSNGAWAHARNSFQQNDGVSVVRFLAEGWAVLPTSPDIVVFTASTSRPGHLQPDLEKSEFPTVVGRSPGRAMIYAGTSSGRVFTLSKGWVDGGYRMGARISAVASVGQGLFVGTSTGALSYLSSATGFCMPGFRGPFYEAIVDARGAGDSALVIGVNSQQRHSIALISPPGPGGCN
jgi:hypothetical protein